MRSIVARKLAAGALAATVAVTVGAIQTTYLDDPDSEVLGAKVTKNDKKAPVIDASCDVDGVTVSYDAAYAATPAPAGYKVVEASIGDVAPTCADATVTVTLLEGDTTLATGTAGVGGPTVPVALTAPPPAQRVTNVSVEIAGGDTPVPEECESMEFDQYRSLSLDDDTHAGGKGADLVYGLGGHDTLRGGNKDDCLVGQAGNDRLFGDNHDDVLLGGPGDDTLEGGNGDDLLIGGDGDDVLRGGQGRDVCIGGPGTTTYDSCEVRS